MPAVGRLEAARARVDGAGERALLVPEQLALEQRLGQRRAGDLDEGLAAPRAVLVQGLREQLLAGAALAEQQHGGRGGRHLPDRLEHREHLGALADQVVEAVLVLEPLAQRARLLEQPLLLERLLEHDLQLLDVDRLAEVVLRAQLHGLDGGLHRAVGRHHDDHRLRADLLDLGQQLDAVHARHAQVGQHDVGLDLLEQLQPGARVVRARDLVAVLVEQRLERRGGVHLVVDDHEPPLDTHVSSPAAGFRPLHGQAHREGGAPARLARGGDLAAVLEHDLLGDREAEAGALRLGGHEQLEHVEPLGQARSRRP